MAFEPGPINDTMTDRRPATRAVSPRPIPWVYLMTLALGLSGIAIVAFTADQPTVAWRKFVAVLAASLCYLSLSRLFRLRAARVRLTDRSPRRRLDG